MRWLLCLMLFSILMPTITYLEQSATQTAVATLPYLSYGLYFALRKFDIDWRFFVRLSGAITVIAIITHLINLHYFPNILFEHLPRSTTQSVVVCV